MNDVQTEKLNLRKSQTQQRLSHWRGLGKAGRRQAAVSALGFLRQFIVGEQAISTIAGFWPLDGEFDLRPVLSELSISGYEICLPLTLGAGRSLEFRRWHPGDVLAKGSFGVSVPQPASPVAIPDLIMAPLLAFDPVGHRLGYGGGYYDRTLIELRATSSKIQVIGVAFEIQRVDAVPVNQFDQPLDGILTEVGYYPATMDD